MLIDEQVDHGAVVVQKKVEIPSWPISFLPLQAILAKEGSVLLSEILSNWIKRKVKAKEQNDNEATFTKKVEKVDGFIDLSNNAYKNYLKYLAYEEWPGVFFEIEKNNKKIKVIIKKAHWNDTSKTFEIERVVPEGKKEMDYKDFLRGF